MNRKCYVLMVLLFAMSMPVVAADVVADWANMGSQVNINTVAYSSSAGLVSSGAPGDMTIGWGGWNNTQATTNWRIRWRTSSNNAPSSVLQFQGEANTPGTYLVSTFGSTVAGFNTIRTRFVLNVNKDVRWMVRDASTSNWYVSTPVNVAGDNVKPTIDSFGMTEPNWIQIDAAASGALNEAAVLGLGDFPTPETLGLDDLTYSGDFAGTGLETTGIDAGGFYFVTGGGQLECDYVAFASVVAGVNAAPDVSAGGDTTIYLADGGELALIDASVVDDNEPNDPVNGYVLTTQWTAEPSTGVSFDDSSLVKATATFTETGVYVLTLTADDTEFESLASLTVTVEDKLLSTMEFRPIEDTYTAKNTPNNADGELNRVQVRDISVGWARNAYFKFDTGQIPGNILGGTLMLNAWGASRNSVTSTDSVYAVTGEWSEDTLTWNNDDLVWGEKLGSLTAVFAGGTYHDFPLSKVDVSPDGKVTLGLSTDCTTAVGNWKSSEHTTEAQRPLLTIVYDPQQAVEFDPADLSTDIHPGTSLTWSPAEGATAHDVYLGKTSGELTLQDTIVSDDPNLFSWIPSAELDLGQEYFWRIDEVINGKTVEGEEWSFTVAAVHPDFPILVSPVNGNINVVDPVEFTWNNGSLADSHDLYIGTDPSLDESVKFADVTSPFTITNLDLETEYFWTVQATAESGETWVSNDVFSFTTGDFATLDSFNGKLQWVETPSSGADVNSVMVGPEKVMRLVYDDAGGVKSEVSLTFTEALNLSGATGREALVFRFYGQLGNGEEDMYIALSDVSTTVEIPVLLDGEPLDPNVPLYKGYELIQIPLADFAPVNLEAVTSITIGLGDGIEDGRSGTVYFDNINVRTRRCVPAFVAGDLIGGDCMATLGDYALIAKDWLRSEAIVSATEASDDGLIVQFDFDEAAGATSVASSVTYDGANYATATVEGAPILGTAGYTNNAIDMASAGYVTVVDPGLVFASLGNEITVSLWCYGNIADLTGVELAQSRAFRFFTDKDTLALDSVMPDTLGRIIFAVRQMGISSWMVWNDSTFADWTGAWNHYAFVIDAENNFQAIYCNGVMVARTNNDVTGYAFDVAGLERLEIGNASNYHGKIDDFRVYNRALDASEIVGLAGKASVTQGILSNADITGDGTVNMDDFAEVADIWLSEILWPEL